MADLYTSQVHLKRLLAGQATPAFTPAPEAVLKVLDPEFFPGMGALNEDERGLLQCPVRECGEWHAYLSQHMNKAHPALGGMAAIRAALDIPASRPFLSERFRQDARKKWKPSKAQKSNLAAGRSVIPRARRIRSMASRNEGDVCPGQHAHRLHALAAKVGHSPSFNEFIAEYDEATWAAVRRVYGTWNNFKGDCGLPVREHGACMGLDAVLAALSAWYEAHGDLPTSTEVQRRDTAPLLPSIMAIYNAFGVRVWHAAMSSAIEHLGITSERYGAPTRRTE